MDTPARTHKVTQPGFLDDSQALVATLRNWKPARLGKLMNISDSLAELNTERFQRWHTPFSTANARPAIQAFRGDVYVGLDADTLSMADLHYAQNHLRILSGLYGLLRPLDLMQAYRLEMGTTLKTPRGKSLYDFWGGSLTDELNRLLNRQRRELVVNLASNEYFKAIRPRDVAGQLISPVFRDEKNGAYKTIGFFAKRARGAMARYLLEQRVGSAEGVPDFTGLGYRYSQADSSAGKPVFLRSTKAYEQHA